MEVIQKRFLFGSLIFRLVKTYRDIVHLFFYWWYEATLWVCHFLEVSVICASLHCNGD